jgi:hypothetical protein
MQALWTACAAVRAAMHGSGGVPCERESAATTGCYEAFGRKRAECCSRSIAPRCTARRRADIVNLIDGLDVLVRHLGLTAAGVPPLSKCKLNNCARGSPAAGRFAFWRARDEGVHVSWRSASPVQAWLDQHLPNGAVDRHALDAIADKRQQGGPATSHELPALGRADRPGRELMMTARPFTVEHVKRRTPAAPKPAPAKPQPMQLSELLERVVRIKDTTVRLRGVGRFGPEAFTEDKSELRRMAERLEDDLRRRGVSP